MYKPNKATESNQQDFILHLWQDAMGLSFSTLQLKYFFNSDVMIIYHQMINAQCFLLIQE